MIISELFNWLQKDEELHLANRPLSRELLELEQSEAQKTNRVLLSEMRLAKLSGLDASDAVSRLEKHILFMDYLGFCRKKFDEDPQNSLFLVTLKYLLSKAKEEPRLSAKLNELFGALLQEDRANALIFYQQNEVLFKNYPKIQKRVALELYEQRCDEAAKRVENHLVHLSEPLSNQKNPLGIIRLCRDWIGDTEHFAALILWLLQRNVNPKQILQSYLLHDFLKYHLFTLHSEDNEVFHLYALLNRFPQAKLLVEAAKQTGSDERGFQQYALNGVLSEKELQGTPQKQHPLQFSLTASNFLALHQLFGQDFLTAAVITATEHNNSQWLEVLRNTLNEPSMLTQGIQLINVIAREASPKVLENLAGLIDDQTAQQLLSNNEGAVFYLLPYKPKLFEYINAKNVVEFIHQITLRHHSEPEVIFQLMALFSMLPKTRNLMTHLVFRAIIDNLVQHPHLLEDEKLVRQLRKYPDCNRILTQQSKKISQQVNDCMILQTAEAKFSSRNYQLIEDVWLEATRKHNVFKCIKPQAKFTLNNKYALQAKIAETAFLCHGDHFDLDAFVEALSLPPVNAENGVSEYERVLIEILAIIDNELIRKQIIEKLESYPVLRLDWAEKEYDGRTIFLKAAKHGNLGLVTFLENKVDPKLLNKSIITAAKENQWETVAHLCQIDKVQLNEEELEEIILLAAGQGRLKIIKSLLSLYHYEPSATEIIKILNQAITHGKINVVKYFYNFSGNLPNQSTINKLFNAAIESEGWDTALFLAGSEHPPSLFTIEKGFNQAINAMQLEAMQGFCDLSENSPRPQIVQKAFIKACQLNCLPVVQCLHDLLKKLPIAVLKDALEQAIVNENANIVIFLCRSSANQDLINHGLMAAVKTEKLAFIKFFGSITTKDKPTQHMINQAGSWATKHNQVEVLSTLCALPNPPSKLALRQSFLLAAKDGKRHIIAYLCTHEMNSLNQRVIEEALIAAVKFKKSAVVRYLCELPINAPQRKSLRIAFSKAVSSGQNELADYLSEQIHGKKSYQKTINSEIDPSSETNRDLEMNNISEIENLSGLEIDDNPTMENHLTMDSGTENAQDSGLKHVPKVGIPLKSHGLFQVRIQQNLPSISEDLVGSLLLG